MTLTVVDLGCADPEGRSWSVHHLADRYKPDRIYGFDPSYTLDTSLTEIDGCPVILKQAAASTYDGAARYTPFGPAPQCAESGGHLIQTDGVEIECFGFSRWLTRLDGDVVVKMDIEGSEYEVLEQMIADGTDLRVSELLVEWHGDGPREDLENRLACPVEEWGM